MQSRARRRLTKPPSTSVGQWTSSTRRLAPIPRPATRRARVRPARRPRAAAGEKGDHAVEGDGAEGVAAREARVRERASRP